MFAAVRSSILPIPHPRLWIPNNRCKAQPPSIDLFAQFVGVLFHSLTGKPVTTARSHIEIDLPSNIFVERQQAVILHL
jgi:hypothetical protein